MQYDTIEDGDSQRHFDPEEQSLDELIIKAVDTTAKGENVEQVLEVMLVSLPASEREKAKKKFSAALAKRGMRQPSGEPDIPSRTTLARIRASLSISTRQMIERIMQLVRSRPDIARNVQQAGKALLQNGVAADRVTVSEGDLGTMAPAAGAGKRQQDRGSGRNA
jgi:hypothetical protein